MKKLIPIGLLALTMAVNPAYAGGKKAASGAGSPTQTPPPANNALTPKDAHDFIYDLMSRGTIRGRYNYLLYTDYKTVNDCESIFIQDNLENPLKWEDVTWSQVTKDDIFEVYLAAKSIPRTNISTGKLVEVQTGLYFRFKDSTLPPRLVKAFEFLRQYCKKDSKF